eukprot:jgi/Mesvir1/13425/Mv16503-RA.1
MTFSDLFDGIEIGYGGIILSRSSSSPSSPSSSSTSPFTHASSSSLQSSSSFALDIMLKNNFNLRARHTLFTGPWRGKNPDWSLGTHRGDGVLTLSEFRGRRYHSTGVDFGALPRGRWLRLTIVGTYIRADDVSRQVAPSKGGVRSGGGVGAAERRGGQPATAVQLQTYYIDGRKVGEVRVPVGVGALQMVGNGGYQMRSPWGMLRNLRVCSGVSVPDAIAAEAAVQAPLREKLRELATNTVDGAWAGELAGGRMSVVLVGNSEKILRDSDRAAQGGGSLLHHAGGRSTPGKGARLGDIIDSHDAVFRFNALDVVAPRLQAERASGMHPPGSPPASNQWEATVDSGRSTPGGGYAVASMRAVIGQVVTHDVLGDLTQLCGCGNGHCCSPDHVHQLTSRYGRRGEGGKGSIAKPSGAVHLIYARESQTPQWAKQLRQEGRVRFTRLGVAPYDISLVNLWLDDQADKGPSAGQGKGTAALPGMLKIRHRLPPYNSFRTGFRVIVALLMRGVVPNLVGFDLNEETSALLTGGRKWAGRGRNGGERYLPETRVLADLVDAGLLRIL